MKKNFTHYYKHKRVLASRNENLLVSKLFWKQRNEDGIYEFCIYDLDELPLADQKLAQIETPNTQRTPLQREKPSLMFLISSDGIFLQVLEPQTQVKEIIMRDPKILKDLSTQEIENMVNSQVLRFWQSLVQNWIGLNKRTDSAVKRQFN